MACLGPDAAYFEDSGNECLELVGGPSSDDTRGFEQLLNHIQIYVSLLGPARSEHSVESMIELDAIYLWKYVGTYSHSSSTWDSHTLFLGLLPI